MKRIITLALAAGLFMGATAQANAAEIDVYGKIVITGQHTNNLDLIKDNNFAGTANTDDNGFDIKQRLEVGVDIQNSENLKAHIRFRAPSKDIWGTNSMAAGGGNLSLYLTQAYVDWFVPTTDVMVRMGLQPVYLGTTLGSPVLDDTAAGVSVIAPINDMVTVTAHWMRAADYTTNVTSENLDIFALTVPMIFDGFSITPWAAFAYTGEGYVGDSIRLKTGSTTAYEVIPGSNYLGAKNWWVGFSSEFTMFDPFTFALGAAYGASDYIGGQTNDDSDGFVIDAKLDYATMYGTPSLYGWYASGDDESDNDGGRIGYVSPGWGTITTAFFDQSQHGIADTAGVVTPTGTWALGLSYSGFQPMDDLTLGGHVMYVRGTNDFNENGKNFNVAYMSNNDSVVELAAYATYEIYKDLQTAVEVNYLIADQDKDYNTKEENGLRVLVGFQYNF